MPPSGPWLPPPLSRPERGTGALGKGAARCRGVLSWVLRLLRLSVAQRSTPPALERGGGRAGPLGGVASVIPFGPPFRLELCGPGVRKLAHGPRPFGTGVCTDLELSVLLRCLFLVCLCLKGPAKRRNGVPLWPFIGKFADPSSSGSRPGSRGEEEGLGQSSKSQRSHRIPCCRCSVAAVLNPGCKVGSFGEL